MPRSLEFYGAVGTVKRLPPVSRKNLIIIERGVTVSSVSLKLAQLERI